jgi:20S proteasome alpha/beta subunit
MTIGLAIKCQNGIVLASDSLASAGNTSKYAQKIHVINHECLLAPVIIVGAGSSAFIDKFIDRCQRGRIEYYCQVLRSALKNEKYMLDIVDFSEGVAESIVCDLYDHYVNNRSNIFGNNVWSSYELQLLVAGATKDCEFRAFTVYHNGISENIETYGTIGSGAQYAEIFLRELIPSQNIS